ncbi:MAG: hypothetical protein ACYSWO_27580 [Planctomycetota bacterium]|jgi:hypothetical protein
MTNPKDVRGREINEGDTVFYPVRRGSSMWLKSVVVKRVVETSDGVQLIGFNDDHRRITLRRPERCVVVEVTK